MQLRVSSPAIILLIREVTTVIPGQALIVSMPHNMTELLASKGSLWLRDNYLLEHCAGVNVVFYYANPQSLVPASCMGTCSSACYLTSSPPANGIRLLEVLGSSTYLRDPKETPGFQLGISTILAIVIISRMN